MIVRNRPTAASRWLRGTMRVGAVGVLVTSVVYCTNQAELTSVDVSLTPVVDDASRANAAVRKNLSTWLDSLSLDAPWPERGEGEEPGLEVVGSELDSPWSRRVAAEVMLHLESLLAEGPAGPNAEALSAAFQGRRLPTGTPHYFVILSRAEDARSETVVVDLARLREAFAGTGASLSQKDLEAVIRRSASMEEAGWIFKAMAGFSE